MLKLQRLIGAVLAIFLQTTSLEALTVSSTPPVSSVVSTNNVDVSKRRVVSPNEPFRDTRPGEVSIVSFNALAPSLHALNEPWLSRAEYEKSDRELRVPAAIEMAARLNADVLCLQEVEGGRFEEDLRNLLSTPRKGHNESMVTAYDSLVWSPLHPHREEDCVGLCVAWRSDKHTLISSHSFRRGMVVCLEENQGGSVFSIGNVHLPARPSDVGGRLNTVATACHRLEAYRKQIHDSPLDGAAIVVGDFNCDTDSSPIKLLKEGFVLPGILFERNYRYKLTKTTANRFRHGLRFLDVYGDGLRKSVASVTVSLTGRRPGSMDHVLFSPGKWGEMKSREKSETESFGVLGRRQKRRSRAKSRTESKSPSKPASLLRAVEVLATIDPSDEDRTSLICSGLPRLEEGFPSDHLPVGALLAPVSRMRNAYSVYQRHDTIVRAVKRWLARRGATDFIVDEPLYKWKWLEGTSLVERRSRAPDICCVAPGNTEIDSIIGQHFHSGSLLIVEVCVSSNPDILRKVKAKKYSDLPPALKSSDKIQKAGLDVPPTFVLIISRTGEIPPATVETLNSLAELTNNFEDAERTSVDSLIHELLRIRAH